MSEWISVAERLPEPGEAVDIWADGERLANYEYIRDYKGAKGNNFFDPIESGLIAVRNATHWMPLPPPPGEKGKE